MNGMETQGAYSFFSSGHTGLVRAVSFCKDRIVSSGYDQSIRVWDATTGTCLLNFQSGHSSWIFDVNFDDKRIISSSQDGRILVMDFAQGLDTRFICR
jgi:F-box and WD-40 domain protein 1/11